VALRRHPDRRVGRGRAAHRAGAEPPHPHRRGLEPRLVAASDRLVRAGVPTLAINGAILLVLDLALGGWVPFLLTGLTTLWFGVVWYLVPRTARERPE
jgi:hypothetical protein